MGWKGFGVEFAIRLGGLPESDGALRSLEVVDAMEAERDKSKRCVRPLTEVFDYLPAAIIEARTPRRSEKSLV